MSQNTNVTDEIKQAELLYLEETLKEVEIQLKIQQEHSMGLKRDLNTTQKNMWDDVAAVPNDTEDLDQLVQAKNYLDEIKIQNIQYGFSLNELKKLRALQYSPYFGRIDFRENGENQDEPIYIGIGSLIRGTDQEFLVYDWRAPISGMYYEYEVGPASYECLDGTIEGNINLKRQYRISNGKMHFMFDCNLTIEDEVLQEILASSSDSQMKNIVTTIQRNQNRIIRNDTHDFLIVNGTAGSGKTSVALHRVAWLLYKYRDTVKADNIVVLSPNNIFNHYISNVLPSLGEDNMRRMTFKDLCLRLLGNENHIGDFNNSMELSYSGEYSLRSEAYEYKMSKNFLALLNAYYEYAAGSTDVFDNIYINGSILFSKQMLHDLYRYDFDYLSPAQRFNRIKKRLLSIIDAKIFERATKVKVASNRPKIDSIKDDTIAEMMHEIDPLNDETESLSDTIDNQTNNNAVKDAANDYSGMAILSDEDILPELGDLTDDGEYLLQDIQFSSTQAKKRKLREAKNYYAGSIQAVEEMFTLDAYQMYVSLFSKPGFAEDLAEKNGLSLPDSFDDIRKYTLDTLNAGIIDYEDAISLCLLKVKLGDVPSTGKIKHVIIDEVQDYTPAQLTLIHELFDEASMTLLGDKSQTINRLCDYTWDDIESVLGAENCLSVSMNKAYRSTVEINRFAGEILKINDQIEVVSRHGEAPRVICTNAESGFDEHIQNIVNEFKRMEENGCFSIGILCMNEQETRKAYELLKTFIPIRQVHAHDTTFHAGPSILPVYLAKGLEFDGAILFNANESNYPNENYSNLLYTACTRPLHYLSICSYGKPSELLPQK